MKKWIEPAQTLILEKRQQGKYFDKKYQFLASASEKVSTINNESHKAKEIITHRFIIKIQLISEKEYRHGDNSLHDAIDVVTKNSYKYTSEDSDYRAQYFFIEYRHDDQSLSIFLENNYKDITSFHRPDIIVDKLGIGLGSLIYNRLIWWAIEHYPNARFNDLLLSSSDKKDYREQPSFLNVLAPSDGMENIIRRNKLYMNLGYTIESADLIDGYAIGSIAKEMKPKYNLDEILKILSFKINKPSYISSKLYSEAHKTIKINELSALLKDEREKRLILEDKLYHYHHPFKTMLFHAAGYVLYPFIVLQRIISSLVVKAYRHSSLSSKTNK